MSNKLIDRLEELADEMKVIVHQLRVPSTIQAVEDVIEFEGQQYKKVDREAREGDVIVQDVAHSAWLYKGKPYKMVSDEEVKLENGCVSKLYTGWGGRTPETVDVYELIVEDKQKIRGITIGIDAPKSANQLRAEVIEKAKGFVEEAINQGKYGSPMSELGNETYQYKFFSIDFDVNDREVKVSVYQNRSHDKRMKQEPLHVNTAKCNPSDVFNEHIGKAIALGRALGLDVSEFENAVQPKELVTGHLIEVKYRKYSDKQIRTIVTHEDEVKSTSNTADFIEKETFWHQIINDTNAEYEVNA
ncbi:hypothetical protein [Lysinibacillus odysseyi]|uniref:Uncharacterized protein n=1 Tax=Lysinibacillus odysseyi 34hs-1 = NBRC 100172 TaxID=1220589 RepID=A0A0A3J0T4_9BACI|nr:hypothetical protein [Lysinibacillus odysseyi]KGR89275.1 hypothetical protein CD32_00555 [Lysinibacillus odysseyi 34hs-1 = NBRC 100172]